MHLSQHFCLEMPRLWLVNCDRALLQHLFEGDDQLARYLDITVPEKWTELGDPACCCQEKSAPQILLGYY